ncbi:hypothetical protein ACS0TY_016959 [Phlomoides rotata]
MTSYIELYGPEDSSVLTNQKNHRSEAVFVGTHVDSVLRSSHAAGAIFWSFRRGTDKSLHSRVLDVLYNMGFYGVARCGPIKIDQHLTTALVERWRSETHTFHLPVGEATITLQDVAIMWGLSIDGNAVVCADPPRTIDDWRAHCEHLLGFVPRENQMKGKSRMLMSALKGHLENLVITDDTPQMIVDQYARGCALLLIGGLMMPDSSRNTVALLYLQFLENVEEAGRYSWASAVLAFLYRELCTASDPEKNVIGGALTLLQIWAWSRISTIAPENVCDMLIQGPLEGVDGRNLGVPPYAGRWVQRHSYTQSTSHSLRIYRDIFDRLSDKQFTWQPYDMMAPDIASLSSRCLSLNYMSECPLINLATVELYHPDRVLRQFGRIQVIPRDIDHTHKDLHAIDRRGRDACNWTEYHRIWIQQWNQRKLLENTMPINKGVSMSEEYMEWYRKITRRLISPDHYNGDSGYQPPDTTARDAMIKWMERLKVSTERATFENKESFDHLRRTSIDIIQDINRLLHRPPYLVDPQTKDESQPLTIGPSTTKRQRRRKNAPLDQISISRGRGRRGGATQGES